MKILAAAAALLLASVATLAAAPLAAPEGKVVLTIKGNIENTNGAGTAQFDLGMLESLSGRHATMETPWTNGSVSFDGPFLKSVLEAVGARGQKLIVKALNDYSAEVPMEDATALETILAVKLNGEYMSVRDKGPVFLIYPFDKDPGLYNEKYFSRSVWQISEIEIVD